MESTLDESLNEASSDSEDDLPSGWESRVTEDGRVFFIHHSSKKTTWNHPKSGKRKIILDKLPTGWRQETNSDGSAIYVHDHSGKSTTFDPRLALAMEEEEKFQNKSGQDWKPRFGSTTTACQILNNLSLIGQVAIVTGASGGVGLEIGRSLALRGARVILACRNLHKANKAIKDILDKRPNVNIESMYLDLASMESVQRFARSFVQMQIPLHMLICNAAIFGQVHAYTEDGFERTFQVNHLAHFYLVHLLRDKLMASAPSRLVMISCESHHFSRLRLSNLSELMLSPPSKNFEPIHAYNNTKLCNVSLVHQFQKDYQNYGVNAYAAHPGSMISGSDLGRAHWAYRALFAVCRPFAKSLQQAAATPLYCACSRDVLQFGGTYWNNCNVCMPNPIAKDEQFSIRLWKLCEQMITKRMGKLETLKEI